LEYLKSFRANTPLDQPSNSAWAIKKKLPVLAQCKLTISCSLLIADLHSSYNQNERRDLAQGLTPNLGPRT